MDGDQVCKIYLFGIYWNFVGNFQNFWDLFGFSRVHLIYLGFLNNFWNSFRIFWYLWDEKAAYISHQNYPKRKFDGIIWLHNQHISPFSLLEGHMTWLCQPSNYLKRKFDPIIWLCKQPTSPFSLLKSHMTCLCKPSKFPFLESHQP